MLPEPTANLTLTDDAVRTAAVDRLRPALGVQVQGYKVSTDMLLDALVYAAAAGTSLHGAAAELSALADDTTLRDHLNGAVNASFVDHLDQRLSAALTVDLPGKVFEGRRQIAIDLHDQSRSTGLRLSCAPTPVGAKRATERPTSSASPPPI